MCLTSLFEPLLTPIERPRCPNCQTRMMKTQRRLFIAAKDSRSRFREAILARP